MATIIKDRNRKTREYNGCRSLQFIDTNGKRRSVRLGKVTAKAADTIKVRVEALLAAAFAGLSWEPDLAAWVNKLATGNATLYDKLAAVELLPTRVQPEKPVQATLGAFVEGYIASRLPSVKPNTARVYRHTRDNLITYFGAEKPIGEISPGHVDEFRAWLTLPSSESFDGRKGRGLGDNTARKCCGVARQFFRAAVRKRIITDNPFADMAEGVAIRANKARDYFVTREEANKILKACPDNEWRLIFALSRFGGCRCPSEHLAMTWGDVDFEAGRVTIRSPKTAHHEGHESRVIPLFPELEEHLQAALDELLEDFDPKAKRLSEQPVIRRHRDGNANLRTQLMRIMKRAGVAPWPKLFQNMRATRATELAAEFPAHVAADWLGHSTLVAQKHYWQTTDADFAKATKKCKHKCKQTASVFACNDPQQASEQIRKPAEMLISAGFQYTPQESNL